jgi:hypothetical protein
VRTPAKPSTRFGRSGDFSFPSASAPGFTVHMRTEKRRTYRASCAMVHAITHHACSPFSLCRILLITTHLEAITVTAALAQAPASFRFVRLSFPCCAVLCCCPSMGHRARLESAWLPAGIRWRKALSYSHKQGGQPFNLWLSNVFGHLPPAYLLMGCNATRLVIPFFVRMHSGACALSLREAAGHR